MRIVGRVAVNVFKESVRDKVLYNLVVFAVLLIAASYLLGQLTAGQDVKIIKDLGLASISIFGPPRSALDTGHPSFAACAAFWYSSLLVPGEIASVCSTIRVIS